MSDEAATTIKGARLTEAQSAIMRMAVEKFAIVIQQGLKEEQPGIVEALTDT